VSDTTAIDIGHGLTAALRTADSDLALEGSHAGWKEGDVLGVLLTHPCSKRGGEVVQDFIPVNYLGSAHDWKLESRDPITISPSVSYTCCGTHGFLRDGKWVPA